MKRSDSQTAILCSACLILACGNANAQTDADEWQYSITPYLWLPTIEGALKYHLPPGSGGGGGGGGGNLVKIEVGPSDWLDLLNFGLLVSGSAKKGRFTVFSDLVYLSLTSEDDRVASVDDSISVPGTPVTIPISANLNVSTRTDLDGLVWTIAGGYAIKETDRATIDLFAGVRYFGVDFSSSWDLTIDITTPGGSVVLPSQGTIGTDVDLWDGIMGIRGQFELSAENWAVLYNADIGTGSSELTWQAMGGIAYSFGWGDLALVYRHLAYDQDSNSLIQDLSFSGPAFGAKFRF